MAVCTHRVGDRRPHLTRFSSLLASDIDAERVEKTTEGYSATMTARLIRVTGIDRPGITTGLMEILAVAGCEVFDIEQVAVRDRLALGILVGSSIGPWPEDAFGAYAKRLGLTIEIEEVSEPKPAPLPPRHSVVVLGSRLSPTVLAQLTAGLGAAGGNIERIVRLSRYPVVSYEFTVSGAAVPVLRASMIDISRQHGIDVAVQEERLERYAKRIVMLDVDSTLIEGEMVDLLAAEAGRYHEVAEITRQAMEGRIGFEEALRRRVRLLAGLDEAAVDRVRAKISLVPGARTFVRTLKRLGYTVAAVSGGFHVFLDDLTRDLNLDYAEANTLEISNGLLTGELVGRVVDRRRKATALREVAEAEGVPLDQTIAVGDGANDLDLLATAGMGIAYNARSRVREVADTTVSVPYLDAVLFLLGISRDQVEAADAADPLLLEDEPLPVPGTPPA